MQRGIDLPVRGLGRGNTRRGGLSDAHDKFRGMNRIGSEVGEKSWRSGAVRAVWTKWSG